MIYFRESLVGLLEMLLGKSLTLSLSSLVADLVYPRFTELVQQDHENERAEATAKQLMELTDEGVEKGFSGSFRDNLLH